MQKTDRKMADFYPILSVLTLNLEQHSNKMKFGRIHFKISNCMMPKTETFQVQIYKKTKSKRVKKYVPLPELEWQQPY